MSSPLLLLGLLACATTPGDSGPPGDDGAEADGGSAEGLQDGGNGDDGGSDDGDSGDGGGDDQGDGGGDGGGSDGGAPAEGDCALRSDLVQHHYWEGDTISFSLTCTGSLTTGDAEIQALAIPGGASFDPSTLSLTWVTGPEDGGRWDLSFSSRPAGATGSIPVVTEVTIWVADNPDLPGAVAPDPGTYTEEWGLPVIHIDTSTTLSTSYQAATVHWQGDSYEGEIKIRGATSSYYPKPSYTLDFDATEPAWEAFGATREHLVLLTTFDDNSYVRQKLIYDQWQAIAEYWD